MYRKYLPLFFTILTCYSVVVSQTFQQTQKVVDRNFHDLNTEPLLDGTDDFIVGGNLLDASFDNPKMFLQRVDSNGSILWFQRYGTTTSTILRLFDLVTVQNTIYVTGYIIVGASKKMFVAKIDAGTGSFLDAKIYDVSSPNEFSRGFHISYTESDANNDTNPDPGLLIGGFYSNCFSLDLSCDAKGFVVRTDSNLNPIWTHETESNLAGTIMDYDAVNSITETTDGFFITGATNFQGIFGNDQQAVLAHKIAFNGLALWDTSYEFGNAEDKSVDAYFDAATQKIYMLCNYSSSHNFAITALENSTGAVDFTRSWRGQGNDLDRYGFTLYESLENPMNLVIAGYDKDEFWTASNSNNYFSNSSILIFQFNKDTRTQVGPTYQYLIPHSEPLSDDYNFWTGQFPLIYFPSMSFSRPGEPGTTDTFYYHLGYRTNSNGLTNIEFIKTEKDKVNDCDRLQPTYQLDPIAINAVTVTSSNTTSTAAAINLTSIAVASVKITCQEALAVVENKQPSIHLYPNPAFDKIYISSITRATYTIYDTTGKEIASGIVKRDEAIDIATLDNSFYFISIIDGAHKTTLSFIKK